MISFIITAFPFVTIAAIILLANLFKDNSISATPALAPAKLSPVKSIDSEQFELADASLQPLLTSTPCPPSRALLNLRPLKPIEVSRLVIRDDNEVIKRVDNLSVKGLALRPSRSEPSAVHPQMTTSSQSTAAVLPTETTSSLEKLSIVEPAPRSRPRKTVPIRRKKGDPKPVVDNGVGSIVSSFSRTDPNFDALLSSFEGLSVKKESAPKSILRSSSSTTVSRQKTVHFNTLPTDCDVIFSEIHYHDVARIKRKVKEEERYKTYANTHTPHIFGGRFITVYQGKLCLMKEQGYFAPPSIESDEALVCKAILKGRPCQHRRNAEGVELAEL